MKFLKAFFQKIKSPIIIGVFVVLIALVIVTAASKALYDRTVNLLTDNLRERILTVSITTAANIKASDLEALQEEADWQKPEWLNIVTSLNKAKYSNKDIVFMYIFRKTKNDPSQMEFVADADSIYPYANSEVNPEINVDVNRDGIIEPDGPDKLQWPGQPYPEAVDIPETYAAYDGPITSSELYTDEYGTVLTGYAPIKDENGNTVAVLATDIKADDFFSITTQTLQPFLIFIAFLALIIVVLTITIFKAWNSYAYFLERTNIRLKELDKQKTEFVSLASHQLRAPMTAIKGYIALMLEGDFGAIPTTLKDPINRIYSSTQSMIQIVGDFLDVTRIELGTMKYTISTFDLKRLVQIIIAELKPNIEISGLEFKFIAKEDEDFPLTGDEAKLKQVFNNLIDNAIKYTKKGSVNVFLEKTEDIYRLRVQDTGVGISPSMKSKLFDKFVRADNANDANVIGTGLGLYVAKQMVEKHKGKVFVNSDGEEKGSTFIVEIPIKQS